MNFILIAALSFQCMLTTMENASQVEIKKNWRIVKTVPEKKRNLKKILKQFWKNNDVDSRMIALSWVESRLRYRIKNGDRGKACGIFQIHARYSYPMFRRKGGFRNWKEKDNKVKIKSECNKLQSVKYSVNTLEKYLKIFDKRNLHVCHHNSGIYGKCNTWYKKRVDFLVNYFNFNKVLCTINSTPVEVKEFYNLDRAAKIYNKVKSILL